MPKLSPPSEPRYCAVCEEYVPKVYYFNTEVIEARAEGKRIYIEDGICPSCIQLLIVMAADNQMPEQ